MITGTHLFLFTSRYLPMSNWRNGVPTRNHITPSNACILYIPKLVYSDVDIISNLLRGYTEKTIQAILRYVGSLLLMLYWAGPLIQEIQPDQFMNLKINEFKIYQCYLPIYLSIKSIPILFPPGLFLSTQNFIFLSGKCALTISGLKKRNKNCIIFSSICVNQWKITIRDSFVVYVQILIKTYVKQ